MVFFDKSKCYGMIFENGVEYEMLLPVWKRPLYRIVKRIQWGLWKIGIPWHDWLSDECTPDFNCCAHKYPEFEELLKSISVCDHTVYYNERSPPEKEV